VAELLKTGTVVKDVRLMRSKETGLSRDEILLHLFSQFFYYRIIVYADKLREFLASSCLFVMLGLVVFVMLAKRR